MSRVCTRRLARACAWVVKGMFVSVVGEGNDTHMSHENGVRNRQQKKKTCW
jgi:hypothetical protein